MTLTVKDRFEAQALDINQALRQYNGSGLLAGGGVSPGSNPLSIDIGATTVYLEGERVQLSSTTKQLSEFVDSDNPRKAVVYVDGNAEYRIAPGEPEPYQPADEVRFRAYRPSPADLENVIAVELAEIAIGADDERTTNSDIRSRTLESRANLYEGIIRQLKVDRLTDGAGVTHDGQLADLADVRTDSEINQAVADNTSHGDRSGPVDHDYRTDTEIQNTARGLDASEFGGASGIDGQHLASDGTGTFWTNPPQNEVPVISTGTETATGGTSPDPAADVRLEGVAATEDVMPHVLYSTDASSFNADYALNASTPSKRWDSTNSELDVDLTFTWDTDPGAGNDVSISYAVYDGSPQAVTGRYTDQDAIGAMTGASIAPAEVLISDKGKFPVYADLGNYPSPQVGAVVVASGANASYPAGEYIYYDDGSSGDPSFHGPNRQGVTTLSGLTVDANKDMGGYTFMNLGAPSNAGDALRLTDLNSHSGTADIHHSKTTTLGELNGTPQDVTDISGPADGALALHDGTNDLPRGVARFDATTGPNGAWWVKGSLGEWTGTITLQNRTGVIDTGVSSQTAAFLPALGSQDPDQDVRVSATADWDDAANAQKITIVENTDIGNPTINYSIRRWRY
jgi:hypothetical protein